MKKAPHLEVFCRLITNLVFVMFASASVAASTLLAPATNTSLPNIHMKAVRCAEVGVWSFDIVNNAFAPAHIDYFFGWRTTTLTQLEVMRDRFDWDQRAVSQ